MKAALVVSHGSRSKKTRQEVLRLVKKLRRQSSFPIIEYAFLEIEPPDIPTGIEMCARKGAKEILLLLNFLNSGRHVDIDIPKIAQEARKKYRGIRIHISQPVGQHPKICELFLDLLDRSKIHL